MPIVQIDILEGRTIDQKRELVRRVTTAVAESINCSPSAITIIIREMRKDCLGLGGALQSDNK